VKSWTFPDFATKDGWLMSRDVLASKGRTAGPGVVVDVDCTGTGDPADFTQVNP